MGERMKLIRLSLPKQMLTNMQLVMSMDGRPQAEIIRAVLASYIDSKLVQASVLKGLNVPIPGQPEPKATPAKSVR